MKALQERIKHPDCPRFVSFGDQTINTADIVGIFTPATMEEQTRRKNGQWKCKQGRWHERGESCECQPVVGHVQYRVPEADLEFVAGKRADER